MAEIWERLEIDLGEVKERKSRDFNFKYNGPLDIEIHKMESSCGCTTPVFDRQAGFLRATFKAGKIPQHLKGRKSFVTTKRIKLYTSKGNFTFKFKATIVK